MKGNAALLPLVMVGILILVVAIFGPMQVTAAYEHNWSWLAYTPEAHNWSAFEGGHEQHNWSWMLPEPGGTFNSNAGWWGHYFFERGKCSTKIKILNSGC